jgi:hypothetical protein
MEICLSTCASFDDGKIMVELVTGEDGHTVELAIFDSNKIIYAKKFLGPDGNTYIPPRDTGIILKAITLACRADEYDSIASLFDELFSFITEYVDMDDEFTTICILYVLMTYVYQKFDSIPYLRIVGDTGSGKSTLTRTLSLLCYKGAEVSGCVTVPVIFRFADIFSPTLTIDETDFADQKDSAELIKLLNNGYAKGRSVIRLTKAKGGFIPETFNVFCPKILNGRRRFDNDALESRCISYRMHASTARPVSYQLPPEYYQRAQLLRNKLLKFRFDLYSKTIPIQVADCKIPPGMSPRLQQLIIPLATVAVDEPSKSSLIKYFSKLQEEAKFGKAHSLRGYALQAVKILSEKGKSLRIQNICDKTSELTNNTFYKISAKKVGGILRDTFGLETRRTGPGYELIPDEMKLKEAYIEYGIDEI